MNNFTRAPRVLVVEDDEDIAQALQRSLRMEGYEVRAAPDGRSALEQGRSFAPDLVILDLGLPGLDGLEVARSLRAEQDVPILILTARDALEARVEGLDAGADDYLVKPFATTELVARTKALLRRPGHALGMTLEAGNVLFDTIGRDVRIHGETLALARQELSVLEHLMRRLGRVVPKAVLEEKLYGIDDELGSNAIPVHVHHLRRKLTESGATCAIHTVRGIGYLLTEESS